MYICICNGVTDHAIREQAAEGACSLRDLERTLGVGAGCGRCRNAAAKLLGEALPGDALAGEDFRASSGPCRDRPAPHAA